MNLPFSQWGKTLILRMTTTGTNKQYSPQFEVDKYILLLISQTSSHSSVFTVERRRMQSVLSRRKSAVGVQIKAKDNTQWTLLSFVSHLCSNKCATVFLPLYFSQQKEENPDWAVLHRGLAAFTDPCAADQIGQHSCTGWMSRAWLWSVQRGHSAKI